MSTGLSGTPMPSFSDSLPEADRWALSYYVLSLSAFTDPLTGQKMQISEKDRRRSTIRRSSFRVALCVQPIHCRQAMRYAGETWATKHGFDLTATGIRRSLSSRTRIRGQSW